MKGPVRYYRSKLRIENEECNFGVNPQRLNRHSIHCQIACLTPTITCMSVSFICMCKAVGEKGSVSISVTSLPSSVCTENDINIPFS